MLFQEKSSNCKKSCASAFLCEIAPTSLNVRASDDIGLIESLRSGTFGAFVGIIKPLSGTIYVRDNGFNPSAKIQNLSFRKLYR
jgi:hypothetical protein